MGIDSGHWEEESSEDSSGFGTIEVDPFLDLITDLAICYQAIAEHCGLLCASCTCVLGYHIPCKNGECEFCGCYEIRRVCGVCGIARTLDVFLLGSVCRFCVDHPPVRIAHPTPIKKRETGYSSARPRSNWARAKAARTALKELTE